jgi:hypothetical protein
VETQPFYGISPFAFLLKKGVASLGFSLSLNTVLQVPAEFHEGFDIPASRIERHPPKMAMHDGHLFEVLRIGRHLTVFRHLFFRWRGAFFHTVKTLVFVTGATPVATIKTFHFGLEPIN